MAQNTSTEAPLVILKQGSFAVGGTVLKHPGEYIFPEGEVFDPIPSLMGTVSGTSISTEEFMKQNEGLDNALYWRLYSGRNDRFSGVPLE